MTNRQKALLGMVQPFLSGVYRQAASEIVEVGHSLLVRVPRPFTTRPMAPPISLAVHVCKEPDGFIFRVYDPTAWARKGWTEPKWRRLHA